MATMSHDGPITTLSPDVSVATLSPDVSLATLSPDTRSSDSCGIVVVRGNIFAKNLTLIIKDYSHLIS